MSKTNPLLDKLKKSGHIKSDIIEKSETFANKDMINIGIPSIDLALSGSFDGGLTPGLTVIAGPQATFKTNMCLKMVDAYLRKYEDAVCLFYDSEFGATPDYIKSMVKDVDRMIHIPIKNIEEFKLDAVQKLDELQKGDKVIFFVDSLGNLASKKELADALEGKSVADMTRAKELKSCFRMITPYLNTVDIPMIAIAHIYEEMGLYPKKIISGGCLVENTKVKMSDGSLKNIQDIKVGETVDTLLGPKTVLNSWNPETLEEGITEVYDIFFDDGTSVSCSAKHKFLNEFFEWVEAENISEGTDVISK